MSWEVLEETSVECND